jgi:hypothetical protein
MFIADQYGWDMHIDTYNLGYDGSVWFYGSPRDCMLSHWNL